ncbi:putative non-specific serine/threonine protein kinase [Rosa chinensis]|uniref:Putative non-specific serine/threonine protein kinase n=1 Tax=Rosa chinensis TaxID=74649 RepID=A0A2P6Q7U3_ROSCH|nr:putative non-specific serine/threonine protein kinase [Rosa chinensis]
MHAYFSQTTVLSKGRANEYDSFTLEWVRSFDLSSNNLEGEIPEEISSLIGLATLNLSMNQLSGDIPSKVGNLLWLETLDLSHNNLSGQIPPSFSSFTFLAHLNLSYNNLNGRIPSSTQLQTLNDPSIYAGNPSLCGVPLLALCPGENAPARPPNPSEGTDEDDVGKYVGLIAIFIRKSINIYADKSNQNKTDKS